MQKYKFYDIEQNTDEWLSLRAGKLTSSKLACIMANYGKAFGEPAHKYAVNIAIEQITGIPISSTFSNEHMERGHEQEPIARMLYEDQTFSAVSRGGFYDLGFVGCSPDGNVYDNGQIEIKSVISSVHYANIKRGGVDPAYKWQCIGNMKFSERKWIDFISYCSEFPKDKQLFIFRMHRDNYAEEFEKIDIRIAEFKLLVDSIKYDIETMKYSIN